MNDNNRHERTDAKDRITYLDPAKLASHPRNMRRFYPAADVETMAQSIRTLGIIQPLVGCQGDNGRIWIVAGNLRLAALRHLGDDAPASVPVIIRDRSAVQQLLEMAAENAVRFDPDPVSEGLHYQRILSQPGMNVNRLHMRTGIAPATINNRLAWAELEPDIQGMGMRGELPTGAADYLIKLPPGRTRVNLARRFVSQGVKLTTIKRVIERELAAPEMPVDGPNGPAVALAQYKPAEATETKAEIESPLRRAAAAACAVCPTRDELGVPDPAWSILSHGAREACDGCPLRDIRDACTHCPLVIALRHAYRVMAREEGLVPHKVF